MVVADGIGHIVVDQAELQVRIGGPDLLKRARDSGSDGHFARSARAIDGKACDLGTVEHGEGPGLGIRIADPCNV